MGYEFDRGVEVTGGQARLDAGWVVGGGVNGGYLLAVLANAVREKLPSTKDPLVLSAHFVSPTAPGDATVTTRVVREGTTSTAAVELDQDGQTRITALVRMGDLTSFKGAVHTTADEPALPPVEDCVQVVLATEERRREVPLMDRLDLRLDPATAGWALGRPGGSRFLQGWLRFADGREFDPLSLLFAVDSLPPAVFDLGYAGWAPTLELTVHVRAVPAPGWLRVRHETRNIAGGMFEEDCEVWDSSGRLVAQCRQLALLPRKRQSLYAAVGRREKLLELAQAWHARCLDDPVVSHAFSHGHHPDHVERLAAYWIEQLGGPSDYTRTMGDHTHVVRLHSGNGEHHEMDRRALACFVQALDDATIRPDTRPTLTDWFATMIEAMGDYHRSPDDVPAGLPMRHWGWEGEA